SGRVDMRAEKKSIREEAPKSARGADRKSFTSDPLVAKKSDPSVVLGPPASVPPKRPSMKIPGATSGTPPRISQAEEDLQTLDEARSLSLAGRHVEALRKLEPVAKRSPSSREAWALRGHVLFMLKQFDAAIASAERVTRIDPTDQDALKLMVKVLAATNKDVRALETADRLLVLAPQDPEVHRLRADCLVAAMRHAEAVDEYERVIQVIPDDPFAWVALGRTLRQLRRVAEARMALTKGLSLAESNGAIDLATQARELLAKLPPSSR
ncbi:MAG TPA: tetratricopeptide repeat protein, partial [Labilithrix sp.]|nr:tetratricopeptide repeat protein [Labilithrix sp.]